MTTGIFDRLIFARDVVPGLKRQHSIGKAPAEKVGIYELLGPEPF
jgi:hypothetical protein